MARRAVCGGVALMMVLTAITLLAQGVTIDHKPVGCIVAEKYPKLNACFSPASSLARARVYFRPEEGPPNWYYVEMKADAPCHTGVLPKPKKELIGKKVLYYVNSFDQKFVENRTADNQALVVGSQGECGKDVPVAPLAAGGPAAVFPAVPAGFATAGLGTGAVVGLVAGGAAVVGGGVALATSGGNNSTPTTTQLVSTPTTTLMATLPTTTTTTQPPVLLNAVFAVSVNGAPYMSPILNWCSCDTPPIVTFNMCQSTGPGALTFNIDIGATPQSGTPTGFPTTLGGTCNIQVQFSDHGIASPPGGFIPFKGWFVSGYDIRMRVETANSAGNNPKAHQDFHILYNTNCC